MEEVETKPPGWAGPLVSAARAVDPPLQPLLACGGKGEGGLDVVKHGAAASGSQGPVFHPGSATLRVAKETAAPPLTQGLFSRLTSCRSGRPVLQDRLTAYQSRRYGCPRVSQ